MQQTLDDAALIGSGGGGGGIGGLATGGGGGGKLTTEGLDTEGTTTGEAATGGGGGGGIGGLTTGGGGEGIFRDPSLPRAFTPIGILGSCNTGISGTLIGLGLTGAIGIPTISSVFLLVIIGGGGGITPRPAASGLPTPIKDPIPDSSIGT